MSTLSKHFHNFQKFWTTARQIRKSQLRCRMSSPTGSPFHPNVNHVKQKGAHGDNFGLLVRRHRIILKRIANLWQDPAATQHTTEGSCSTLKPPLT